MALVEQPLKKRKLFDPVLESESLKHIPVSSLSQEEIMRRQRNKEEIRSLYECYRRIRFCISHKDANLMTDFEQAYLSLITASRGCTSAQRIIAELIPRYASYCPTALEAAAKVAINMYNWSLAVILRGEDSDLIAFQTAKTCIFGLVDICCAASVEAPTSSVIRGICSAVFLNTLTFFVFSFEREDIYQIGEDIVKVQHSSEYFSELKQNVADEDESTLFRLFKFRALCLIRIFFCYPKNLLAACFDLFKSTGDVGAIEGGSYFLRQVTSQIDAAVVTHPLEKVCEEGRSSSDSIGTTAEGNVGTCEGTPVSDGNQISDEASLISKNCLLGMALGRDPSLRDWIFSKYNYISNSVGSKVASEILSALEGITSQEWVRERGTQEDGDEDNSDPSQYLNRKYMMTRISNEREGSADQSGRNLKVHDASTVGSFKDERDPADRVSGQPMKCCNSERLVEPDVQSVNDGSHYKCESSRSMNDPETLAQSDSCHARLSKQKKLVKNQLLSPVNRKLLDLKNDSLAGGNHLGPLENQLSQSASCLSAMRSNSGCATSTSQSPEQPSAVRYPSSTSSHIAWYFDGDPAAMDVISASTQLWLGSLGPNATESLVRFQFENFGPIERFLFFPIKGFALVEYKNIFDAIKAREYMQESSPWGAPLRIKFLDIGLGSRGSINGVAVGASCHVYIGKVSSQWAKDEIMHEFVRVGFRFPRRVTDLTNETALLMEFETVEEAAVVMVHLRQYRKESGYHVQTNKSLSLNASGKDFSGQHINGSRCFPTPNHVEFRCNNLGSMPNNMVGSPHYSTVHDSPVEHYKTRLSRLSSLLSSLSSKYNISQSSNSFGGHRSRNYQETSIREEDRLSSSTLSISITDTSSPFLTDDELMSVCHLAAGNAGSVVRLQRTSMQMSCCWFVDFSSVDAAVTALKNLQSCPVSFFQIEFSQPGNHNCTPFISRSESTVHDLVSPIINSESHGTTTKGVHSVQSNWNGSGYTEMPDGGSRKAENMAVDLSHPEAHSGSHSNDQVWMYMKPETQPQFSIPGSMSCAPMVSQGPTVMQTQQQVQASSFMHPVYRVPNNSWDPHSVIHPLPLNHISPGIMPNNLHVNVGAPPFLPASVTPVAQLPGVSMQHFDQAISLSVVPLSSPPPPPPDVPPPSPPLPPLPVSLPPHVPPPPSSPPPQPAVQLSNLENCGQLLQYQWQGVLCKSGIHYCTIYALREKLDACKYSNPMSEPAEWPTRLDVTKRTDFQHVKLTFASTPPHKREVCRLLPSTAGDQKGYQDFVSYLKQRECAGVIKIPAGKSMWARLLFILPCTLDICSMLAIFPYPSECLLALVLPKETSSEWL